MNLEVSERGCSVIILPRKICLRISRRYRQHRNSKSACEQTLPERSHSLSSRLSGRQAVPVCRTEAEILGAGSVIYFSGIAFFGRFQGRGLLIGGNVFIFVMKELLRVRAFNTKCSVASLLPERFDCVWGFLGFSSRSLRLFHFQVQPQLAQAILDLLGHFGHAHSLLDHQLA